MSVLVKGMERPKSCLACDFCNPFTEKPYCRRLMKVTPKTATLPDCPLDEVLDNGIIKGHMESIRTNAERIRSMTDEELSSWINDHAVCNCRCEAWKDGCMDSDSTCMAAWLEWLKEEVKE